MTGDASAVRRPRVESAPASAPLTAKKSTKIRPAWADRCDKLALKDTWTKGGRAREIPIRNDEQRLVLDEAKALGGRGSLIPADRSYVEQLRRFEHQCAAAGVHCVHGHRHQYALIIRATFTIKCKFIDTHQRGCQPAPKLSHRAVFGPSENPDSPSPAVPATG